MNPTFSDPWMTSPRSESRGYDTPSPHDEESRRSNQSHPSATKYELPQSVTPFPYYTPAPPPSNLGEAHLVPTFHPTPPSPSLSNRTSQDSAAFQPYGPSFPPRNPRRRPGQQSPWDPPSLPTRHSLPGNEFPLQHPTPSWAARQGPELQQFYPRSPSHNSLPLHSPAPTRPFLPSHSTRVEGPLNTPSTQASRTAPHGNVGWNFLSRDKNEFEDWENDILTAGLAQGLKPGQMAKQLPSRSYGAVYKRLQRLRPTTTAPTAAPGNEQQKAMPAKVTKRKVAKSTRDPWTAEEDAKLRRLRSKGHSYEHCASRLPGRSKDAIASRWKRLQE